MHKSELWSLSPAKVLVCRPAHLRYILLTSEDVLFQNCTRLAIRAFHFFAAYDTARTAGLIQLYSLSCSVLDMLHELDVSNDLALYSTQWLQRMLIVASHSILKITRSDLRTCVDLKHGERAYFKAIMFSKKRSAENNDLDSRNAIILTQLWASDSIFRKRDGTLVGDRLRMRSRLVSEEDVDGAYRTILIVMLSLPASFSTPSGTGE